MYNLIILSFRSTLAFLANLDNIQAKVLPFLEQRTFQELTTVEVLFTVWYCLVHDFLDTLDPADSTDPTVLFGWEIDWIRCEKIQCAVHEARKQFLYAWQITWVFMWKDVYTYHLESILNALNILSFLGCEIKMASRSLQMRRNIALFPRQQHLQTTASSLGQTQNNFGLRLSDDSRWRSWWVPRRVESFLAFFHVFYTWVAIAMLLR